MATIETLTEVRAEARYVHAAPRKAQLIVSEIRGRTVPEARTILAFMTRAAARDVERVLASAVANAETNHGFVGDDMIVSAAYVGSGPTLKRWRARARGRVGRIKKRTCHITIRLAPIEEVVVAPPASEPTPRRARRKKVTEPVAAVATESKETPAPEVPAGDAPAALAVVEEATEPKPPSRRSAAPPKADAPVEGDEVAPDEKPKRTRARKKVEPPADESTAAEGDES